MKSITATPAYSRDYKSRAAVLTDWDANKDFNFCFLGNYFYANKQQTADLKKDGYTHIQFRYARLAKTFIYELK
jgi:hypothetical protein